MQTIDPKYINAPKIGKKFGSVVDVDGTRYMVASALIGQFDVGQRYECEVETQTWGADSVVVVKRVHFEPPPNGTNGISTGTVPIRTNGNGHGKDEQIFTLAVLKSFIEAGRIVDVDPDALVRVIESLRKVWRETFGK